jgi:tetratricopeptide (TPR) repeat protein
VLRRAAVVGKDFPLGAVGELLPEEGRGPLGRHLRALVAKGLLQERPAPVVGGADFQFRHILVQQAAYRAIPKSLRAELHERFAAWLERLAAERADEYDELVGYHLEQAVRYHLKLAPATDDVRALARRGAEYLEAAGASAHARGDARAAVRLLRPASSLLERDDQALARLLTRLGAALMEAGQLDEAAGALEEAQRVAEAAGHRRAWAHARVQQLFLGLQVDTQRATATVTRLLPQVLDIFERGGDELGLCLAWRLRAAVRWTQANSAAAEEAWQRAADHARRAHDERQLNEILGWLASAALWGPTPAPDGIRRCERYLAEVGPADRAGRDPQPPRRPVRDARPGRAGARAVGPRPGHLRGPRHDDDLAVTHPASFVAMVTGDPAMAETHLRRDYDSLQRMGEKGYLATTTALLARALAAQGRHSEAEQFIRVSRQAGAAEDASAQMVWQGTWGRVLAYRGRLAEAEKPARAAVSLAEGTDLLNHTPTPCSTWRRSTTPPVARRRRAPPPAPRWKCTSAKGASWPPKGRAGYWNAEWRGERCRFRSSTVRGRSGRTAECI